jgi:Fe-S cluster biogenesis protein NfuA
MIGDQMSQTSPDPKRMRRLRFPDALPKPPENCEFPWATLRDGLLGMKPADYAVLLSKTDAWARIVRPRMEEFDRKSEQCQGRTRAYKAEQLELVLIYGRAHGLSSPRHIREKLGQDGEAEARTALGLTHEVAHVPHRKGLAELPSKDTLYRHKNRIGERARDEMMLEVFAALRDEALEYPEMQEATRILYLDGYALFTHYTAPRCRGRRRKTDPAVLINPQVFDEETGKRVRGYTAEEAGNRGGDKTTGHEPGDGWVLLPALAANGLPLTWVSPKIQASEPGDTEQMLRCAFAIEVKPKLKWDEGAVGVATADAGFQAPGLRRALHELGYVPNIQELSHKKSDRAKASAAAARERQLPIHDPLQGVKKWYADGHRQLLCECGEGHTFRRVEAGKDGRAVTRVEGSCKNCGSVSITAGQWRTVQNPPKKVTSAKAWLVPTTAADRRKIDELRAQGRDVSELDWQFGNPLTFDDPIAQAYGEDRFGHQEGFFGTLANRFGVGCGKSWHRTAAAQRIEISQTFCLMYALALAQWNHARGGATVTPIRPAPPPTELDRAA